MPKSEDDKLHQLISNYSEKINPWIDVINNYMLKGRAFSQSDAAERANAIDTAANVLGEISELFFKHGGFKDEFNNNKMYLNFDGFSVIIKAKKVKSTFYYGIDGEHLYLNAFLHFPENLRYMDDGFYRDIFELEKLGHFELRQSERYTDVKQMNHTLNLFSNEKSVMFKLFRNYFVGVIEKNENFTLGDLHISWDSETDFTEMILSACKAFKIMYKLNYRLWKASEIKKHIH